jgi:hypothetical protein
MKMGEGLRPDENFLTGGGRDTSVLWQGRISSEQIETNDGNPVFRRVSCFCISSICLRQFIYIFPLREHTHLPSLLLPSPFEAEVLSGETFEQPITE